MIGGKTMIDLLRVYGVGAAIDVALPTISVGNWSFTLERGTFSLSEDAVVHMTVLDNRWCFDNPLAIRSCERVFRMSSAIYQTAIPSSL